MAVKIKTLAAIATLMLAAYLTDPLGVGVEATRLQLVKRGVILVRPKIKVTTHSPILTPEEEAAEARDIDINIELDETLGLPDNKVATTVEGGIQKLIKFAGPLQGAKHLK